MKIIPVGFGYYLVKFDNDENQERVLIEGPWTIQGHYLTVRQWSPSFTPSEDSIDSTLAWIRFPKLSMMYYNEGLLFALAFYIGKPVKIDINTRLTIRSHFA